MIDDELKKHPERFPDSILNEENPVEQTHISQSQTILEVANEDTRRSKSSRARRYIPSHGSGAYAILLALYRHVGSTGFMSKEEIMSHGQQYSNHPFRIYDPSRHAYTAWTSMKTLIGKDLVCVTSSRPIRYTLTDEGVELATLLSESCSASSPLQRSQSLIGAGMGENNSCNELEIAAMKKAFSSLEPGIVVRNAFYEGKLKRKLEVEEQALQGFRGEPTCIPAGSFEVLLVVDNREVRKRSDRDFFQFELEKRGVPVLTKQMELGDICWVARSKLNPSEMFLLDYIVERKANDDLASSIMDNRFTEQKHRLSRCGISNLIYLVESYDPTVFSAAAMTTALTETMVSGDYFVKVTRDALHTVEYLSKITKFLKHQYHDKDLYYLEIDDVKEGLYHSLRRAFTKAGKPCLVPFATFNSLNSKTKVITYGDLWQKQLLTIRGVSREKVRMIIRRFPTFFSLITTLDECRDKDSRLKLFTDLNLSVALSRKILSTFTLFG
jgi:crossover junction endonuclease MUS81